MGLPLRIAIRFLVYGRGQTLLIVGGIAVAISVQVFVGLLIDSLQAGLISQTVGNAAQVTVQSTGDDVTISNWEYIAAGISNVSGVKQVGATASAYAFVRKGNDSVPVVVRGLDTTALRGIYGIPNYIYEGRDIQSSGEVLLGRILSDKLDIAAGDLVEVSTPGGARVGYRVAGLFDLGVGAVDGGWVVADLRTGQSLFDFGGRITSIEITVDDVFLADSVAAEIVRWLNTDRLEVTNWKAENGQLLVGLESQSISNEIIQGVIIVSVAIAIASLLSITVLQKRRQVGILKAMGIKDNAASLIFVSQALLIGVMASVLGILLGLGMLYLFSAFVTPGGAPVVAFVIKPVFLLRSFIVSTVASAVSGLVPARRSLQLNPIDVIREG